MAAICPPMTFVLPGDTATVVMPALRALGIAVSKGFMPSTARISGVTGSVASLQSSPSHLNPSSDMPICVCASISPGSM